MSVHKSTPGWRRYLRFWGSNLPADVTDELRFHLDMRVQEYIARGMAPGDARRLAEQRFGDVDRARASCVHIQTEHARHEHRLQLGAAVRQDIQFGMRVLRRQALPTVVAAICIALGIGATTAMFSVANTMLLRPLPYPNGDRLVSIGSARRGVRASGVTVSSLADIADWRARQHSFVDVAATTQMALTVASGVPLRAGGAAVSPNLFKLLGVTAETGRLFLDADATPGAPSVAIVSRGFAERQLGGVASIVGQRIRIAGARRTIVGVLPDRWSYPVGWIDIWFPLTFDPTRESRGNRHLDVIAELRPGVTPEAADRDMRSIGTALARENPVDDAEIMPFVQPLRERFVGPARPTLIALASATLLILLVACANVAALQLARSSARTREIAVRGALGARRGRIIGQLLTESVLLGLVGGAAGVGLAFWTRNVIARAVAASTPSWMTFDIDLRALSFAVGASVLAAIVFGLAPAIRLTKLDAAVALHGGSATGDRGGARLQRLFVIVELALSVILVIGAGLAIESVIKLRHVPLGFDPARVMTFRVSMQGQRYDSPPERARVVAALAGSIAALPGVASSAATTYAPVVACCSQFGTTIEGRPPTPERLLVTGNIVTPGFFATMRIPIVAGRDFTADDDEKALRVVIISNTFAVRYWPDGNAPGHRIDTGNGMATIVGVVGDIKQGRLVDAPEPQFYRPYAQDPWATMAFVVRMRGTDTTNIAAELRRAARDIDPVALPIARVISMQWVLDDATSSNRVLGQLLALFACVALALAAIGIYAIMSFFVARRTRELGVRIALGATSGTVLSLVLRQSASIALIGGTLGLIGGIAAARALAHTLYGVSAAEPLIYVAAAGTLAFAAFAASVGPARRASSVDPLTALRAE